MAFSLADKVSGIPHLRSLFLYAPPRFLYVMLLSISLAHTKSQRELAIQLGVSQEKIPTLIQVFHQSLVRVVAAA
jgi:hypothetical protein